MVSTTLSVRFSPIVNVFVFELKRIPSSYYPGPATVSLTVNVSLYPPLFIMAEGDLCLVYANSFSGE